MEQQLKQRLVGAIVLVSLAVIFIPIILEGPKDEWAPRSHTIPEPPAMDFNASMELPLPAAVHEQQAPDVETDTESKAVVADKPPPAAKNPPGKSPPVLANGWYVQVGSFSQADNARGLRDRLRKTGYDAHLQSTKTVKGKSYRVLVGPSRSRKAAEKLQGKLVSAQQLQGIVIEFNTAGG